MLKKLRRRFIWFNMLIISLLFIILAIAVLLGTRNELSINRFIMAVVLSLIVAFVGSFAISKYAVMPIKKSWQKQLDFTADASHELRTPLAVIRSNLEIVMESPGDRVAKHMKWLENIHIEQQRMTKLVDDLLTLSRADTGEQQVHKAPFILDSLLYEISDKLHPICMQKGIHFKTDIDPYVSFTGDRHRIHQLILIILDNAFQYTDKSGNITLEMKQFTKEIKITITDTGIGISDNDITLIFNRFFRVTNARQQNPDGSGLGLAIAQLIVSEHNGIIDVESNLEKGTSFTITFPKNQ